VENRLVGRLSLAVGLRVSNGGEPSLATQIAEVVSEPIGIEVPAIIKDDGTGDAEASNDVLPNELSYFSGGDGGDSLSLNPLGEVVHCYKKILTPPHSFRERAEDIHSPSSEWQGTDNRRHRSGGYSLDELELLALVSGPY